MKAKCVKYDQFGIPKDVLKVEEKHIELPSKGEVLVRMQARPINPSDLIPISGAYSHRISLPMIPGYEGVGTVEEVGVGVSKQLIGKRALPLRGEGTWQDYVKTSADFAVEVPNWIDDRAAAQLYINPITAWVVCTDVLKLKPGDTLLVNAGGSTIGRIFAQLAKLLGVRLIAVTRNDKYTDELFELGAYYVLNSSEVKMYHSIMELTNGFGVTSAIDMIGGVEGTTLAFCVRPSGYLLSLGLLSGKPLNWKDISRKTHARVKLFHLRHWNAQVSVHKWQETFQLFMQLMKEKKVTLAKDHVQYELVYVKEAVRIAAFSNGGRGKVFLV